MKLHSFEQYSPEWWAIRAGRITASEVGPFVTANTATAAKARNTLVCKKLAELAGEVDSPFANDAMKRGTALEPIAREVYATLIDQEVAEVGFIEHDTLPLGASPDGAIGLVAGPGGGKFDFGAEIKCPQGSTMIKWLRANAIPADHIFQVHMSMILGEVNRWDFFAFCPRVTQWNKEDRAKWICEDWERGNIPHLHLTANRDSFTDTLSTGLDRICEELAVGKTEMKALWDAQCVQI